MGLLNKFFLNFFYELKLGKRIEKLKEGPKRGKDLNDFARFNVLLKLVIRIKIITECAAKCLADPCLLSVIKFVGLHFTDGNFLKCSNSSKRAYFL